MPEKYLSQKELLHVIPSGKRILRDEAWDRRFENYWIGVEEPEVDNKLLDESYYWYDVAQDVVKKWKAETGKWVPTLPGDGIPKLAFETKTWRHVGKVDDDASSPPAISLDNLEMLDDEFAPKKPNK